jgi:hypothetical protein
MDKTILVDADIHGGREIVDLLLAKHFPLTFAFWFYSEGEYADWRLAIATPLYDQLGPLKAVGKLDEILREAGNDKVLWMTQINLVSDKDPVVCELSKKYPPGKSIGNPRFSGRVGSKYLDSAYIYPLKITPQPIAN